MPRKKLRSTDYQLDTKKLSSLSVDEGSFRSELGDLDELADSIREKGILQPITISKDNRVLAGRRRFAAAKAAGLEEIPVIIKHTVDELDEREIELFENIHRKDLTWQEQMRLTARIHELMIDRHGEDWSKQATASLLGRARSAISDAVNMTEAMKIVPGLEASKTADQARRRYNRLVEEAVVSEALEEAQSSTTKRSIIWAANHYQVGDALTGMSDFEDSCAHIAEVDPPYGIDLKSHMGARGDADSVEHYNEVDAKSYPKFLKASAALVYRALYDNSWCIWWFGPTWQHQVLTILREAGFKVDDIPAIWYKIDSASLTANPNVYLNRGYEPFFICRKGSPVLRTRGKSNVFSYTSVRGDRIHPTERPVDLIVDLLETFVYPGANVLSPFLGSGNTILAAYKCSMIGWGWDLSESYRARFLARVVREFPDEAPEIESNEKENEDE